MYLFAKGLYLLNFSITRSFGKKPVSWKHTDLLELLQLELWCSKRTLVYSGWVLCQSQAGYAQRPTTSKCLPSSVRKQGICASPGKKKKKKTTGSFLRTVSHHFINYSRSQISTASRSQCHEYVKFLIYHFNCK